MATFNASLYRDKAEDLRNELSAGDSAQARQVAALLQHIRPDIVLINEIDYREDQAVVQSFVQTYLAIGQTSPTGQTLHPIAYPHVYSAPVNTGIDSTLDLNRDGRTGAPEDAWGYGRYPGQYGMALLSRFPIDDRAVRTFQKFLWHQLPEANAPTFPSGERYYPDAVWRQLRLSSKSHWDVPVQIGDQVLHVLASHPTPPAFDGPEDRNGCRNADEIRFWLHYIDPLKNFAALIDDQGKAGGLPDDAAFVIVGDLNSDPSDGSGQRSAIVDLLQHPRVQDPRPKSPGATAAADRLGGANRTHRGDPACDTSQFSPKAVGNLRVDYCLPSSNLTVLSSEVFWPAPTDPAAEWVASSDHRLVWVDLTIPPVAANSSHRPASLEPSGSSEPSSP